MNGNLTFNDVLNGSTFSEWFADQLSNFTPLNVVIALIVALAAGIVMLNARRGQCVAWVGGQPIDDQEQVMNLIASDLGNMGDASDELQQSMLNQLTITN